MGVFSEVQNNAVIASCVNVCFNTDQIKILLPVLFIILILLLRTQHKGGNKYMLNQYTATMFSSFMKGSYNEGLAVPLAF